MAVLGCKAACMDAVCWQDVVSEALLTTPPTPCMLGGHDGGSNSVNICGTPALLHPDPPPYIASQQENNHATCVSSACRFVPSGTAQRVTHPSSRLTGSSPAAMRDDARVDEG